MIEVYGNLWSYPNVNVRVITTNGTVKKNGRAVMGRGCAKEAVERFPGIDDWLGETLTKWGNHVFMCPSLSSYEGLFTFPVKHEWHERASIRLIEQSAMELRAVVTALGLERIVMPRPGCGNGQLDWEWPDASDLQIGTVKYAIEGILDDRFHVITFKEST